MVKGLRIRVDELNEELADKSRHQEALECLSTLRIEIKRERIVGRKGNGGGGNWPVRIVLLICELLMNGTAPRAVPANIRSVTETVTGQRVDQNPSVNFVRQCRVVVQNLNKMLAAYCLGNTASRWKQVFNNGTSRRLIAFQNLVIGIVNGDEFESVIASSCIFLENETSQQQVEGIIKKVCAILCVSQYIFETTCIHSYINCILNVQVQRNAKVLVQMERGNSHQVSRNG